MLFSACSWARRDEASGSGIGPKGPTAQRPEVLDADAGRRTLFRAEAVRILLIVFLLGWVLTSYKEVIHPALFLSFVVSVLVFRAAIVVKEH